MDSVILIIKREIAKELQRLRLDATKMAAVSGDNWTDGGVITKAAVEGVLTGPISSHSHANPTDMSFEDLDDVPLIAGNGGKFVAVKSDATGLELVPVPAGGTGSFDYGLVTDATSTTADYGGLT